MALTQEELDRLKFSGEGISRKEVPTMLELARRGDAVLGKGINYIGENLPKVPERVLAAVTPERRGVSGEVDPIKATGRFLSSLVSSAPNTFSGAEMAASAGQRPLQGFGFGSEAMAEQPAPAATQMDVPVLDDQSKVAARENLTGTPANLVAQPQGFRSVLSNGLTMTGDMQGNRTYTMGTPGQDGYGMMTVRGGQNAMAAQNLAGARPQQAQSPYTFEGSPEDRSRFMQQPTQPAMQDGNTSAFPGLNPAFVRIREQQEAEKAAKEQLAKLDPRSGWGWKGRQELYKNQQALDQRDREVQARSDIASMQETGNDRRAMMNLAAENQRNQMEQQRFLAQYPGQVLDNQIKLDDLANRQEVGALRNQLRTLTPGTPQYDEIERRLATLSGKFGEQKEPNIQMIEEQLDPTDPSSPMVKRPVRINRDGSYTRMNENVAPTAVTAESIIMNDPLSAERYAKLSPEDRTRMIQEMNKRMAERQAQ